MCNNHISMTNFSFVWSHTRILVLYCVHRTRLFFAKSYWLLSIPYLKTWNLKRSEISNFFQAWHDATNGKPVLTSATLSHVGLWHCWHQLPVCYQPSSLADLCALLTVSGLARKQFSVTSSYGVFMGRLAMKPACKDQAQFPIFPTWAQEQSWYSLRMIWLPKLNYFYTQKPNPAGGCLDSKKHALTSVTSLPCLLSLLHHCFCHCYLLLCLPIIW